MIKLPIELKPEFKEALKNFKDSYKDYIKVLERLGFKEYSLDIQSLIAKWTDSMFEHLYKNNEFLQVRSKAFSDFEEFKQVVIKEQSLFRNDELSSHYKYHMERLNELRRYIPDYKHNEDYQIEFFTFEDCELQNLLKGFIQDFYNYKRFSDLVANPYFGFPPYELPKSLQQYLRYYPSLGDTEPTIEASVTADPNREGWYRIIEEESLAVKALR